MAPREQLQSILETLCDHVYFQPPENVVVKYPCIIYNRDDVEIKYANNELYNRVKRYEVTVIDRDPDSIIPDEVAKLPMCKFNRFFTADGMNHDVYQLFF